MSLMLRLLTASTLFVVMPLATAGADAVRAGVERYTGMPIVESVSETGYGGLYEVVLRSGEVVYADAEVSFIMQGEIIDTRTGTNVTEERLTELRRIDFSELPLDQAIKQVRGDGARVLVTFDDPNCSACRAQAAELEQLDNVTIYTFLYPILGEGSDRMSRDIWCAEDRGAAWNDWILRGVAPAQLECDTSAIDANLGLGMRIRVFGTPTMFLADGFRIQRMVPAVALDWLLSRQ